MPEPEPKAPLKPTNAALRVLRDLKRLTQGQLGRLVGAPSRIVEIENGRQDLPRPELERYVAQMKVPAAAVPVALGLAEAVAPSPVDPAAPWEVSPEKRLEVERAALDASAAVRHAFLAEARAACWAAHRAEAERLWKLLAPHEPERRRVIARMRAFATWALVERLCAESLREAPRDPALCRSLAELAVEVARR